MGRQKPYITKKVDFIQSNDKVAQSLLRSVYTMLKDHEREEEILKLIEGAYIRPDSASAVIIDGLLREVQEILQGAGDWEVNHRELYKALEQIVVLGAREKVFKEHFEQIENTISQALRLNFREKAPLTEVGGSRQNIINYTSLAVNTILERLYGSVTSQKTVDAMLDLLQPGTAAIVTDEQFTVLFTSSRAKELFKENNPLLIGTSLQDLFTFQGQLSEMVKAGSPFEIQIKGSDHKMLVSVPPVAEAPYEISEHVFLLQPKPEKPVAALDLSGETEEHISLINQVIGAANYIIKNYKGEDEQLRGLADMIYTNAWQLKEKTQGSLDARLASLPAEYEPIDFTKLSDQVAQYLEDRVTIWVENNQQGVFFSIPHLLKGVLRDLVTFGLAQSGEKAVIRIMVENWDEQGVILAVDWDLQRQVLSKSDKNESGLQLVGQNIKRLGGTLSYHKDQNYIVVKLPHPISK